MTAGSLTSYCVELDYNRSGITLCGEYLPNQKETVIDSWIDGEKGDSTNCCN